MAFHIARSCFTFYPKKPESELFFIAEKLIWVYNTLGEVT